MSNSLTCQLQTPIIKDSSISFRFAVSCRRPVPFKYVAMAKLKSLSRFSWLPIQMTCPPLNIGVGWCTGSGSELLALIRSEKFLYNA